MQRARGSFAGSLSARRRRPGRGVALLLIALGGGFAIVTHFTAAAPPIAQAGPAVVPAQTTDAIEAVRQGPAAALPRTSAAETTPVPAAVQSDPPPAPVESVGGAAAPPAPGFTLVGTIVSSGERAALLRSKDSAGVERVAEGQRIAGWTAVAVFIDCVVLQGPGGRIEVKAHAAGDSCSRASDPPPFDEAAAALYRLRFGESDGLFGRAGSSAALDRWKRYIDEAASRFGMPPQWIREVMRVESGGQAWLNGEPTVSPAGAIGLMQVMPQTFNELKLRYGLDDDPYDPRANILAGAAYIREMYDLYGAPGFLAAYNAGPQRMNDHLANDRPLPSETAAYLARLAPRLVSPAAAATAESAR